MDQSQELRFVNYLFDRVRGGLTGGSEDEIVGAGPREQFHAGVLLPMQIGLPSNGSAPSSSGGDSLSGFMEAAGNVPTEARVLKVDTDSSMGIDFQVRLPEGSGEFVLRIQPRFSVYYAVFPTYQEVIAHQYALQEAAPDEEQIANGAVGGAEINDSADVVLADGESQQVEPDLDLVKPAVADIPHQLADEVDRSFTTDTVREVEAHDDTVSLPRKFRRKSVELPVLEIPVSVRRLGASLEIRDPFTEVLADLRSAVLNDPDLWRHLGKPSDGARELPGHRVLVDEQSYMAALGSSAVGEVALPAWRAYLSISGASVLAGAVAQPGARTDLRAVRGDGQTQTEVQTPRQEQVLRLNVALVNATPGLSPTDSRRAQLEEGALFNSGLSVEINEAEIVPFVFHGTPKDYRYNRDFPALGSNCVALSDPNNPQRLYTETVPLYIQPWYRTRDPLPVKFAELDISPGNDPLGKLGSITSAMDDYLAEWDDYLKERAPHELDRDQVAVCLRDREAFRVEIDRYKLGLAALRRDADLLRAFRLMNTVFERTGEQRKPPIRSWRLFQIVFMVIQLPALAAREHDVTTGDEYSQGLKAALDKVDVLWFPTGGGKTEAYLGLIATTLFYDRLRGKDRGLTAWMRFPLRMLSLQQLERLAQVVAQAEMLRAAEPDLATAGSPFSIGYYVGSNNTPNILRENAQTSGSLTSRDWSKQQIIRSCPFCRSNAGVKFDREKWRLLHYCSNSHCYSNTANSLGEFKGSLPIFVVDNEVYRYRPSVLVGTVDKLAILGFQKNFAHLFTSVNERCPTHGYLSFGQCLESTSGGPCTHKPREYVQLRPEKDPVPALLIQDELHLLKEELGTFNAHYEGFLHHLAIKQGLKPPKVLAATATIESYEEQIAHLYLKEANRFPQPGWRIGESFYATSTPLVQRRLYTGILTHQRSPETTALRALFLYHQEILRMKADPGAAIAQLGLEDVSEEYFSGFLHLYDLSLTYVNRKATGGNIAFGLYQSVAPQLSQILRQPDLHLGVEMLTGDNTMTEVGGAIERIERERNDTDDERLDALIATSLISHGVDLERINFLCMVGMPSRYAEYIQASSRAARSHVGLVLVCFKRGDLRERSQYHYFLPNHRYLDRLVEPVAINRFSSFAPKRTVPGLLVGMLLSYYSGVLFKGGRIKKPLDNMKELQSMISSDNITFQQLHQDLEAIIGAHYSRLTPMQRDYLAEAIKEALEQNWDALRRSYDSRIGDVIHPMLSFRDVDETISFVADGAAASFVERITAG
ncbi:MAG TPA: DEAD/DEAH box helicase [Chloroflexia bacterium]|nr:DEAD/DEAH box helicase [Chloroflexia bacterium]